MDLLSAVIHGLGHLLGFDDDYSDPRANHLMNGWLDTSPRRNLSADVLDRLFADADWLDRG